MSEWKECKLADMADIVPGFAFKGEHFGDTGTVVIKIKDIVPPIIDLRGAQRVDVAHYSLPKLEKFSLCKGDYVVAMTGATIGKVGRLKEEGEAYINQRVAKIAPKKPADRDFVYYCLVDSDFGDFVQNNIDSHSAQENISGTSIGRYPINSPPPKEQKAIASVLSSLDDKIDLLHRQNKTLEAMAETLFRQWFVEEAQDDWEGTPFSHFVENIKVPMTPEKLVGRKYIPIDELPMKRFGLPTARPIEEAQTSLIGFEKGDILFGAMRAYFHRVNFAPFPGVTRTTTMVLRPKKPTYFAYSLLLMNLKNSVEYADSHSAGSTMPYAVWKNSLELLPCLKPDEKTLEYFEILVDPILRKIVTNIENINTLETLRDTLLPKLMSGEVQVAV